MRKKDLTGKMFGKLLALSSESIKTKTGSRVFWNCLCDCGKKRNVVSTQLMLGKARSCGCDNHSSMNGNESRLTHGDSRHGNVKRLWRIWSGMRSRCKNKGDLKTWKHYGGRGISVCDIWKNNYEPFRDWAFKNGYKENLTLDRINNNGNYEPLNCRWATNQEQMDNRRKFGLIESFSDQDLINEIKNRGLEIK